MTNQTRHPTASKSSNSRPLAIDLFAGAGGMSLGFEQSGFDVVAAVEIDPIHCAVHEYNFPDCVVIPQSVAELTGDQIRELAGIGSQQIDCVFGGPPCQGFSMIGQRVLDDPRNSLVMDFVRLVDELGAKTFVFENVKGLTVGKHRQFLEELVVAFNKRGYEVRLPWKVLNAAEYGVPQHRQRLILYGAKKGLEVPSYPAPLCQAADSKKMDPERSIGPTCGDALSDLPDAEKFEALNDSDEVKISSLGKPSSYAAELRCLTNDAWHFGHLRDWKPSYLTSSARTTHTPISIGRFAKIDPGKVEPISRFFKLSPTGLSNTLRAGTDAARGAFTSPRPIHYKYPRCVTVREMARLHGFPDWFRLNSTKWHGARQIGNSVPPPLARAIGLQVMTALGAVPQRSDVVHKLDQTHLLHLDMSEAAKYFRVAKPSSKRDRKSGSKKRKQSEIEAIRLSNEVEVVG